MQSKFSKHEQGLIVFCLLLNCFSVYYYAEKYFHVGLWACVGVFFLQLAYWRYAPIWQKINNKVVLLSFLTAVILVTALVFYKYFPKESNGNDRWSDIVGFWRYFEEGKNGWAAHSHLGNRISSMPLNLYLAYPFYKVGHIEFYSFVNYISFVVFLYFFNKKHVRGFAWTVFLAASPIVFIDVISYSNALLNGVLFALAFRLATNINTSNTVNYMLVGFALGASLAFRLVYVMPVAILVGYMFRNLTAVTFLRIIWLGIGTALGFVLLFMPLVLGHWANFMLNNPFKVQAKIPTEFSLILLFLNLLLGYFASKSRQDLLVWAIVSVVLSVVVGAIWREKATTLFYGISALPLMANYLHNQQYSKV
jgi:hypothetical protein